MTKARDRADRTGSDPIRVGNTVLETDSNNDLVVKDTSNAQKKVIASEVHLGTGTDKVILKRSSTDGKLQLQTTDGSTTSNSEVSGDSGGSGGVTVQEEGSDLSTTATTLNFVGSAVTASGSGSTKTINISAGSGGTTSVYANIAAMTATSPSAGDQALVTANSGLYIYNGNGWYKIATVNTSPTISSPGSGASYVLATNGTPTSIEIVGADVDEGTTLQNSFAVTSGSITNVATVTSSSTSGGTYSALNPSTNTTNRFFKITPNTNGVAGSFTLTFSVSDNVNAATTVQTFSLQFDVSGSIFFDGTGDYLEVTGGTEFSFGTGAFTVECWYQPKFDTSGSSTIFLYDIGSEHIRITFKSGAIRAELGSETQISYSISGNSLDQNTWYHSALTRDGSGNVKLFHNGTVVGSYSSSTYNVGSTSLRIGDKHSGSKEFTGYISNFRVIKGTAVYTSGFTPSTSPLTAIANTKLLTANNLAPTVTTNGSYYFSSANGVGGSNARVITATDNNMQLGTSTDFTFECWYKLPVTPPTSVDAYLWDFGDGQYGWLVPYMMRNGYLRVGTYFGTIFAGSTSDGGAEVNRWYHLAITREGSTFKAYLDGTLLGSNTQSSWGISPNNARISLGGYANLSYLNYGVKSFISDFRFVKGLAVYTGNFSVPTGPLTKTGGTYPDSTNRTDPSASQTMLLTANHSSGTPVDSSDYNRSLSVYSTVEVGNGVREETNDDSSFNHSIAINGNAVFSYATPFTGPGGSVYFDGTGDSLSIPNFAMGTDDYTIEMWFYPTSLGNYVHLYDGRGGGSGDAILIQLTNTGTVRFYSVSFRISGSDTVSANTWNHVALERVGNVNTLYLNGVSQGTYNDGGTTFVGPANNVGRIASDDNGSGSFYPGYVSNFRIVKGSAVYNGNFTVPTTSLTAVTNTQILTCNDSNVINDASTSYHTITINGDAIATKFNPF